MVFASPCGKGGGEGGEKIGERRDGIVHRREKKRKGKAIDLHSRKEKKGETVEEEKDSSFFPAEAWRGGIFLDDEAGRGRKREKRC